MKSGLVDERALGGVALWRTASEQVGGAWAALSDDTRRYHTVRAMINNAVTDLLECSLDRLQRAAPADADEACAHGTRLIAPSDEMARRQQELSAFLYREFYNEYRVRRMRSKAQYFLTRMFDTFVGDTGLLPPATREAAGRDGVHRAVCDVIAGMTDREALLEYRRLFDPEGEIPLPA
jgi:dGTPase